MKMIFNLLYRFFFVAATSLLLSTVVGGTARAQATYYTPRSLLADFFPRSQLVTFKKFELDAEQRAHIEQKLGYALPKTAYTFYIAKTGDNVDGYAILDEEQGQHLPITYGVKFSPRGAALRMEIVVYRERYGDEVRDARFREQFTGKTAADPLRAGEDVVAVSGATISSNAMAVGVRRCLVLLDELVLKQQRAAQATSLNLHGAH